MKGTIPVWRQGCSRFLWSIWHRMLIGHTTAGIVDSLSQNHPTTPFYIGKQTSTAIVPTLVALFCTARGVTKFLGPLIFSPSYVMINHFKRSSISATASSGTMFSPLWAPDSGPCGKVGGEPGKSPSHNFQNG